MRTSRLLAVVATTALATSLAATPSQGATQASSHTLAKHLVAPLSLAVAGNQIYVTQNFAGVLSRLEPGKAPKTLYAAHGGNEVGGVSVRKGNVVFTETASDKNGDPSDSWVKQLSASGRVKTLAHVRAYENAHNPDGTVTYGVRGISDACAAQWPTGKAGPAVYQGIEDSHPYATYQTKKKVYVADAGMNAVLAIGRSGAIKTVAVTPAVSVPITAGLATAMKLPACVVGLTYYGESVPTDVVRGPGGKLYVTTEGGGLGEQMPLGAVYRIDPTSGKTKLVAGHLLAPTGLAVTDQGDLIVAQLFAGTISKIKLPSGKVKTFTKVGLPGAVEFSNGHVYATTNVLPPNKGKPNGKVVRFRG